MRTSVLQLRRMCLLNLSHRWRVLDSREAFEAFAIQSRAARQATGQAHGIGCFREQQQLGS